MKTPISLRSLACLLGLGGVTAASAATLVQTFETGENTSNWGSAGWSNYTAGPGFLDSSLGGNLAGDGSSANGQEATRDFRNNTAGIDTSQTYTVSMYVQLGQGDPAPASGNFHIIDGTYGETAAALRLEGYAGGGSIPWQAKDGGSYVNFTGVSFSFDTPYLVSFTVNPTTSTYSTTVSQVSSAGAVLASATLNDLSIGGSIFTNGNNGQLLFHIEGSAGVTLFKIDNVSITDVAPIPEPASAALLGMLAVGAHTLVRRRRRA